MAERHIKLVDHQLPGLQKTLQLLQQSFEREGQGIKAGHLLYEVDFAPEVRLVSDEPLRVRLVPAKTLQIVNERGAIPLGQAIKGQVKNLPSGGDAHLMQLVYQGRVQL